VLYSRLSINGTALSGRKPIKAGDFLCVLASFPGRMCNIWRDYPVDGSFTRILSPPAYRSSTVVISLGQIGETRCQQKDHKCYMGSRSSPWRVLYTHCLASEVPINVAEGPHEQPWHESEFSNKVLFIAACREKLHPGAERSFSLGQERNLERRQRT
jgi:hypothetical protein